MLLGSTAFAFLPSYMYNMRMPIGPWQWQLAALLSTFCHHCYDTTARVLRRSSNARADLDQSKYNSLGGLVSSNLTLGVPPLQLQYLDCIGHQAGPTFDPSSVFKLRTQRGETALKSQRHGCGEASFCKTSDMRKNTKQTINLWRKGVFRVYYTNQFTNV